MQPTSPARAEPRERHRLISPAALIGLVALAGAALVLVFPGASLVDQIYRYGRHDDVSAGYIGSLLRSDPGNRQLRLTLVERLLDRGDIAAAREALAPLRVPGGEADRELRLLEFRLLRAEQNAARSPAEAAPLRERARHELAGLAGLDWGRGDLEHLAEEARLLGAPELAVRLYRRLAEADPGRAGDWTDRAAQTSLAGGEYRATAETYVAAAARARTPEERRGYLMKALKTLQSGNLLADALQLADAHFADLAGDDAALVYLVRLARAANDHARAQAYAKRLMRMGEAKGNQPRRSQRTQRETHGISHPREGGDRLSPLSYLSPKRGKGIPVSTGMTILSLSVNSVSSVAKTALGAIVGEAQAASPPAGMRAYDEERYTLAYEVFLGARNLEDAYRVAAAAVAQVPDNPVWRLRLAQVAEWSGRPAVALAQWRYLAARAASDRERGEAWQAVLRLAPGVRDDEALLAAWLHEADARPMNAERWERLADAFERVARAGDGAAYFQRRYEKTGDELFLGLQAWLLERIGRDDEAIAAYRRLIEKHRASEERLLRVAVLLLHLNRFREAFEVLDRHRAAVDRGNARFWDLFADLAWKLQQDQAALEAYQVVTAQPQAADIEWQRLVELMRERDPAGAARIAAAGYERVKTPGLLLMAVELNWQRRDLSALRDLFGRLAAEDEKRMAGNAHFFVLRAQYHDAEGRRNEATADYRRAMAIEPGNPEYVASLLWHLVSRRDTVALRRELAMHAARAGESPALSEAYASAYALLGETRRALSFYARLLDAKRDDYLWLLNYADVLEQDGQGSMALRVRRHAWEVTRAKLGEKDVKSATREEIEAVARMTLASAPGDPALNLVGRILRQDYERRVGSEQDRRLDAGVGELILSWALSTERFDSAKAWLWQQYARKLARPVWAEMTLALAENDREAVARLLARDAHAIPPLDRIEAARVTGRHALAQTYAFEAAEKQRDHDEIHLKLSETLLESASMLAYGAQSFERGLLKGTEQRASARIWVREHLRLSIDLGLDGGLKSNDPTALTGVPGRIEQYAFGLHWRHDNGSTDLRVGHRNALGTHVPVRLAHTSEWAARISGTVSAALDETADETNPLFLGGMRDRLTAQVNYRLSLREYVALEAWAARYHTQDDTYLGQGRGLTWEIGHRFRNDYPDWRIRLTGEHQSYRADGSVDARASSLDPTGGALGARYFIPESFDVYGLYTTFGDSYRDRYSRAWRYYADFGPTYNTVSGRGFLFAAGAGGSVLGNDRLSIYYNRSKGGSAIGGYTTEVGLRYEYLLDR
jgi:hypothetical protein